MLSIANIGDIDQVVDPWRLNRFPSYLKKSGDEDREIDGQALTMIEALPAWKGSPGEVSRRLGCLAIPKSVN